MSKEQLTYLIKIGQTQHAMQLIETMPSSALNTTSDKYSDKWYDSPIHLAAAKGMIKVVKLLLKKGDKDVINSTSSSYGETPLYVSLIWQEFRGQIYVKVFCCLQTQRVPGIQ